MSRARVAPTRGEGSGGVCQASPRDLAPASHFPRVGLDTGEGNEVKVPSEEGTRREVGKASPGEGGSSAHLGAPRGPCYSPRSAVPPYFQQGFGSDERGRWVAGSMDPAPASARRSAHYPRPLFSAASAMGVWREYRRRSSVAATPPDDVSDGGDVGRTPEAASPRRFGPAPCPPATPTAAEGSGPAGIQGVGAGLQHSAEFSSGTGGSSVLRAAEHSRALKEAMDKRKRVVDSAGRAISLFRKVSGLHGPGEAGTDPHVTSSPPCPCA